MITIHAATRQDIPAITHIAQLVWPPTYGPILPEGQVEYMLNWMYSAPSLSQQMEDGHVFFLAKNNGEITGFASAGATDDETVKLHKLYVLNTEQGKGTGKRLLEEVIRYARQADARLLFLNVNKNNSAYHFYRKNGFRVLREEVFDIGDGYVMDDYIMGIDLD